MNSKINTLFDYIKQLCESDLDRIISFVLSIICVNQQSEEKPSCPYCSKTHKIKMKMKKKWKKSIVREKVRNGSK